MALRKRFYTELEEPPFIDKINLEATEDTVTKMYRGPQGFFICFGLLAWQDFRWYLWLLVTVLRLHEDISVETDDSDFPCLDYQTVPFSEIMVVDSKDQEPHLSGLNYIDGRSRVDFYITREEAYEAYRRFCSMTNEADEPQAVCVKLFDNLWVQFSEYACLEDTGVQNLHGEK